MIFDKDLDEVLNVLIHTSGTNSLEITKFIKNLPKEYIGAIVNSLNTLLDGETNDLTYFKSDNWNYYCHIEKKDNKDKLYLGMYFKDNINPVFYIELISNSIKGLDNYTIIPLGSSGFTANNKRYTINYYLKKFPSEYMITSEAIKHGSNYTSKYHNYIDISKVDKELYHDSLDGIIKDKLNIIRRKRNKH